MSSIQTSIRQVPSNGCFISIGGISHSVYTPASVLNLSAGLTTSVVAWTPPSSFVNNTGNLLLDMGRTVIAIDPVTGGQLTFRKVQYIDPKSPSTNGVSGDAPGDGSDFNVGYILLGLDGAANNSVGTSGAAADVTAVAKYGL